MNDDFSTILEGVGRYYSEKIQTYGATPKGVDWNSSESQALRFEQLLKVVDTSRWFSVNDYGCGYGGLAGYVANKGYEFAYRGFDISARMIAEAEAIYAHDERYHFFSDESDLTRGDYTLASGIFNVKLDIKDEDWERYVLHTLGKLCDLSELGFAFNILTRYSDAEYMRRDLFYADPLSLFDYCKRHFSKYVALLHDYPLFEFTILVRKA
jgi:SAM-dependent methyltransferase